MDSQIDLGLDHLMESIRREVAARKMDIVSASLHPGAQDRSDACCEDVLDQNTVESLNVRQIDQNKGTGFTVTFPGISKKDFESWVDECTVTHSGNYEKSVLCQFLSRFPSHCSVGIGNNSVDCLSILSQNSKTVFPIGVDLDFQHKYKEFDNIQFQPGPSAEVLSLLLKELEAFADPLDFILIDGNLPINELQRNIDVIIAYLPKNIISIIIQGSFNPQYRRTILEANWGNAPYVHVLDMDFVAGGLNLGRRNGEKIFSGGLCLIYLKSEENSGRVVVNRLAEELLYSRGTR
jgi:hypothetical protein